MRKRKKTPKRGRRRRRARIGMTKLLLDDANCRAEASRFFFLGRAHFNNIAVKKKNISCTRFKLSFIPLCTNVLFLWMCVCVCIELRITISLIPLHRVYNLKRGFFPLASHLYVCLVLYLALSLIHTHSLSISLVHDWLYLTLRPTACVEARRIKGSSCITTSSVE